MQKVTLAQLLLEWYDLHGRDLPWRRKPTPYTTLVSEIMLQQTRVEAVLPLYERFIERFPTIQDLAAASQDEVLTYWQGLGYYSRARRLHETAQIIVTDHNGLVPDDKTTLRTLPGIGEYTCGAILSMAFDQTELAIDGNLLRIGARLFLVSDPINRMQAKRKIQANFEGLLPQKRPGDFNQALMDLASRICLPRNPRCTECPLAQHCQALLGGEVAGLPKREAAKPPVKVQVELFLVESQGALLLRKRESGGFLQGMWELPWYDSESHVASTKLKVSDKHDWLSTHLAQDPLKVAKMDYVFSHRHWLMTIFHYHTDEPFQVPMEKDILYQWQPLNSLAQLALPTVFKKALRILL